jgi:hypothetical protein
MSPGKKITRHTIPVEEMPAFMFLGIVSSEPDYRLCVMLNRHLGVDLRKKAADITFTTGDTEYSFSHFTTGPALLSLVSNRGDGHFLLRKMKNIDFLLVLHGSYERKKAEELASSLRNIAEITAVFVFDSREFSDKNISLLIL